MGDKPDDRICRLCGATADLCASHVLPEFGYAALYDDKRRFFHLSGDAEPRGRGVKLEQKGLRERLLCRGCETRLSRWETYVSRLLSEGFTMPLPGARADSRVDYSVLKLFQLSLLWRAHLSTHQMFSLVQLGPHAERLRAMIFAEDPGRSWQYPCVLAAVCNGDRHMPGLITPPLRHRIKGSLCYSISFAGFSWMFAVTHRIHSHPWREYCVREDGTLPVFGSDLMQVRGFRRFAADLIERNQRGLARVGRMDEA